MPVFTDSLRKDISALYAAIFGRLPDGQGLDYWEVRVNIYNWDMRTLAENMLFAAVNDPRTKDLYAKYNDTLELVMAIYKNVFGKSYSDDPEGITYWVREIEAGKTTKGKVIADIVYAAVTEHKDDPATKALLNRAEAGVKFAQANPTVILDTNGDGKISADEIAPYEKYLQVITSDPASIDAALNRMQSEVATGKVFTLTKSSVTGVYDNLIGTPANDIFIAGDGTLETSDVINGGGGIDMLRVISTNKGKVSPTLISVEKIFARTFGDHDDIYEINLANATGVQEAWAWDIEDTGGNRDDNLKDNLKFSGLSKAVIAGIKGGASINKNRANVEWAYNDVTGLADEATLVLDGANVHDVKIDGVETLIIKTQGANSTIDGTLRVQAATKLVITGDKNLTIANIDAAANLTVDASAMTGNLSFKAEFGMSKLVYKGSKGDDIVDLNGTLADGYDIDGGPGINTIKGITNGSQLTADTGKLLKNFQVFDVADGNGTYNMDFIVGSGTKSTITALKVSGALGGPVVINNLAKGADVTIMASTGSYSLTVNQKGADAAGSNSDTLTFILQAPATGDNITVHNLITPDVETIIIKSMETKGVTSGHTLTNGTFSHAHTVKFEGNEQLTVTNLTVPAASLIDASGMTDKFIMSNAFTLNNAVASMIKGGSNDDTLRINEANVATNSVVIGGGGKDSIYIEDSGANNKTIIIKYTAQAESTGSAWDIINGFVAGAGGGDGDKIDISFLSFTGAAATIFDVSAKVTFSGSGESKTFSISAANAVGFFYNAGANRAVAYATDGDDTFVFVDANKDGNWNAADDMAILLVGVNGFDLTAGDNFIFS